MRCLIWLLLFAKCIAPDLKQEMATYPQVKINFFAKTIITTKQMTQLISFIEAFGYLGVAFSIFAESGLFFGFFLPGDSLLFTTGLLASDHHLNIYILIIVAFAAAVIGDSVGYFFGLKIGPRLFTRPKSFFFNPLHVKRAEIFFNEYGSKALILARFIPIVRTFVPIIAGVGKMEYKKFIIYNAVGGALWTAGLCLAGFYLGKTVPNIDKYLLPIILLIIFISIIPAILHLMKARGKE